jgi:ribosomal protein S12
VGVLKYPSDMPAAHQTRASAAPRAAVLRKRPTAGLRRMRRARLMELKRLDAFVVAQKSAAKAANFVRFLGKLVLRH